MRGSSHGEQDVGDQRADDGQDREHQDERAGEIHVLRSSARSSSGPVVGRFSTIAVICAGDELGQDPADRRDERVERGRTGYLRISRHSAGPWRGRS